MNEVDELLDQAGQMYAALSMYEAGDLSAMTMAATADQFAASLVRLMDALNDRGHAFAADEVLQFASWWRGLETLASDREHQPVVDIARMVADRFLGLGVSLLLGAAREGDDLSR